MAAPLKTTLDTKIETLPPRLGTHQRRLQETDPTTTKVDLGGFEREAVVTDQGFAGCTEKPKEANVETTIRVSSSTDLVGINSTVNAVITLQYNSGQIFVIRDATCAAPQSLSSDGKCTIKFFGNAVEQS